MDRPEEKFDAFLALLDRMPMLLDIYFVLFIQQRNIRSGANSMDPWSGLTLITDNPSTRDILGLPPGPHLASGKSDPSASHGNGPVATAAINQTISDLSNKLAAFDRAVAAGLTSEANALQASINNLANQLHALLGL